MSKVVNFELVLKRCCEAWVLSNPELKFETVLANVYQVKLEDGGTGALKIFTPHGVVDEWGGVRLLEWYAGNGAVDVLEIGDGALLMSWLDGGSLVGLCDDGHDEEAALILARLVNTARHDTVQELSLKSIDQRFEFLFNWNEVDIPAEYLARFRTAKRIAARLLSENQQYVPLHGDIHFENALFDGEEWRLIDPKGLLGPLAYEFANIFMNPWSRPEIVFAKGRAKSLALLLSRETQHPVADLIDWAIAHAALAATWCISAGGSAEHPLRVFEVLFDARAELP